MGGNSGPLASHPPASLWVASTPPPTHPVPPACPAPLPAAGFRKGQPGTSPAPGYPPSAITARPTLSLRGQRHTSPATQTNSFYGAVSDFMVNRSPGLWSRLCKLSAPGPDPRCFQLRGNPGGHGGTSTYIRSKQVSLSPRCFLHKMRLNAPLATGVPAQLK